MPVGWGIRTPGPSDVEPLAKLHAAVRQAAIGSGAIDTASVQIAVTGTGSWTRRQLVATGADGRIHGWVTVHDRAAGRTRVVVDTDPTLDDAIADRLAAQMYAWAQGQAIDICRLRGVDATILDTDAYAGDDRTQSRLTAAGFHRARTWLQMTRPVTPQEAAEDTFPPLREGVMVRRVATYDENSPVAEDLQTVHLMLEQSFADHWGSYRESFPEFVQRLREDPGHRWDHWWIATVIIDGVEQPAGALVSSVLSPDDAGVVGSYIDYIGVHRRARGRGVAKALLHTVIRDAASRGRGKVDLEVDADSPTGADGLYLSMGWTTKHRTESWHHDLTSPR
ncbi:GNAT family N-acetyltransferase [Leekyejoonella antrihumi]|uniref:GNAT family N-acetyltransferase n=1 Tax=Leekyejoonella antrihumi TaxID=1660198 RepID=A0A563E1Y8_9MICO|nr:GNAT family N-acetyltransferase [Leekyejoonella antrihumi]